MPTAPATRMLTAARTAYGLLLVCRPASSPELAGGPRADDLTCNVVRVLGGRHLAQAALTATGSARALRAGAVVDTLHAASMIPLAVTSREHRRAAVVSATAATLFAVAGAAAAQRIP
jgi:hypothetical protein